MKHVWKFTLPSHVIGVASAVYAVTQEAWWFFGLTLAIWVMLSIGVEVCFHRLLSHRAFTVSRWVELVLTYLGTIAGQGSAMFWVAVHKGYHHPYSDTLKDPHSPIHGFYQSYIGWLIDDTQDKLSYRSTVDLMRDPAQMFFHKRYYWVISATCLTLLLTPMLFGSFTPLFFGAYMLAATICIQQNFMVNCLCHDERLGYRTYETKDRSRNLGWFSIPSWGLALHNNHHYDPGNWKLAHKSSEIDISSWVIKLIATSTRSGRT